MLLDVANISQNIVSSSFIRTSEQNFLILLCYIKLLHKVGSSNITYDTSYYQMWLLFYKVQLVQTSLVHPNKIICYCCGKKFTKNSKFSLGIHYSHFRNLFKFFLTNRMNKSQVHLKSRVRRTPMPELSTYYTIFKKYMQYKSFCDSYQQGCGT